MVAIITGDIINSRKLSEQGVWLGPLKKLLGGWGKTPNHWEFYRGDSFQLEISNPIEALKAAIRIKATIKSINLKNGKKRTSEVDIRMAIGIGDKDFTAGRISECNGSAFIYSGEKLEKLKKEKTTLAIQSGWPQFDKEMNLYLKLALTKMDNWSNSSGELIDAILRYPDKNQAEIGAILGIKQSSVSGRYKRAYAEEMQELELMYRDKLSRYL